MHDTRDRTMLRHSMLPDQKNKCPVCGKDIHGQMGSRSHLIAHVRRKELSEADKVAWCREKGL